MMPIPLCRNETLNHGVASVGLATQAVGFTWQGIAVRLVVGPWETKVLEMIGVGDVWIRTCTLPCAEPPFSTMEKSRARNG